MIDALGFTPGSAPATVSGAVLIGIGVALQFVPLYRARIDALRQRYPALVLLQSRLVQLGLGFGLLTVGIELI